MRDFAPAKEELMADHRDSLYHGRRTLDELAGALHAENAAAALAHKELSLMHLDRFVTAVISLTGAMDRDGLPVGAAASA